MPLTVADVIGLPVVRAGQPEVLSARRWNDPIRWVHVGDVADLVRPRCRAASLVLTTGAALRDAPGHYLRGLADARRARCRRRTRAPRGPLPAAAALWPTPSNLALVALHRDRQVRRGDRGGAPHESSPSSSRRWRSTAGCIETFTDLSMKRVSATGIVGAAARMLGEPVVLEDLAHQALAVAPGS